MACVVFELQRIKNNNNYYYYYYYDEEFLRTIGSFGPSHSPSGRRFSQMLLSVLCITTNKYLLCVLVVLLHARFSVISPIPFVLATFFFPGHPCE